jgi:hypothetical protein
MMLEADAMFCAGCGTPVGSAAPYNDDYGEPGEYKVHRKKGGSLPLILILLLAALLLVGGAGFAIYKIVKKNVEPEVIESVIEDIEEATDTEIIDFSDVDLDLTVSDECTLDGTIEKMSNGTITLNWYDEMTIYGYDVNGEEVLAEDVTSVYIDDVYLETGVLDAIPSNKTVEVTGRLYIIQNSIYLEADEIYNDGEKVEAKKESVKNSDYIIPHSDTVLLTNADVSGLTLQEINYAKNEIYARHGRRFKSQELQNYFDSKSWYHGTIAPENFKSSALSSIEQQNAEFLSQVEFSISPSGYKLDQ